MKSESIVQSIPPGSRPASAALPEPLLHFLSRRPGTVLCKLHAEASRRSFYRLQRGAASLVAMVYPEPSRAEVERFCSLQRIYTAHGLRVPAIDQVLGDQVVLQEDCGDLLLQRAWSSSTGVERRRLLEECREILGRLAAVPITSTNARLDRARQTYEMDFFVAHFVPRFSVRGISADRLRRVLYGLVAAIDPEETFAHRDFHSRNLLLHRRRIVMVDFQDSLVAPRYYDLVSLAFDSYLDFSAARSALFPNLAALGDDRALGQMRLTALQRNIKALGTFAFQTYERRHRAYARYIPRTLRHIRGHLRVVTGKEFDLLSRYFDSISFPTPRTPS